MSALQLEFVQSHSYKGLWLGKGYGEVYYEISCD